MVAPPPAARARKTALATRWSQRPLEACPVRAAAESGRLASWRSAQWTASGASGVSGATAARAATVAFSAGTGRWPSQRWGRARTATATTRTPSPVRSGAARGIASCTTGKIGPNAPPPAALGASASASGTPSPRLRVAGPATRATRSSRLAAWRAAHGTAFGATGADGATAQRAVGKALPSGSACKSSRPPLGEAAMAAQCRRTFATKCRARKTAFGTTGAAGQAVRKPVAAAWPGQRRGSAPSPGPTTPERIASAFPRRPPPATPRAAAR
mmetsp:Transcript_24542/g.58210  ORF Transcript_24542/g.58210 Transcript_24542/m.58210 type:complete len:272 (+) Transcript_24542:1094-1909(+)